MSALHDDAKVLAAVLQNGLPEHEEYTEFDRLLEAFRAILELVDIYWPTGDEDERALKPGYEQCLRDVLDAMADEFGVALTGKEGSCSTSFSDS